MDTTQLAYTYRLVSEMFIYPEERDMARIKTEMDWLDEAPAEIRTPLKAFLALPAAMSAEEYVATLELTPVVPLYLGAHLYGEPKTCRGAGTSGRNGYMLELANIYRHFGIELDGGEMADFVPVVIEFLAISLDRGDADEIGLRRYFVEQLLVKGFEALLAALRRYESPYAHLVDALQVALAEDVKHMAGGPKWRPPAGDDQPPISAVVHDQAAADNATSTNGVEL